MATNTTPRNRNLLLVEAQRFAGGLKDHGAALGFTPAEESGIRAAADDLAGAEFEAARAKSARREAGRAFKRADADVARFLAAARAVLTLYLGNRWNAHWEPTGFPDRSTKVPRTQIQRQELCRALERYFADHPEREFAAKKVTAAEAVVRHAAFRAAITALAQATAQLAVRLKTRDEAKQKLRRTVRFLKRYLKSSMPPDDPRWRGFGLNPPATRTRPDPVGVVTLTPSGPGALRASWRRARRATRYRPLIQVVGVDPEPLLRNTVHDLFATLEGFTAGQTVRVQIIAANEAGESKPSEAVEMVIA